MIILVEQMPCLFFFSCILMILPHSNCLLMLIFLYLPFFVFISYSFDCLTNAIYFQFAIQDLSPLLLPVQDLPGTHLTLLISAYLILALSFFSLQFKFVKRLIQDSISKWSPFVLQSWKQEYEWSLKKFLFVISTFHHNTSNTTLPVCQCFFNHSWWLFGLLGEVHGFS